MKDLGTCLEWWDLHITSRGPYREERQAGMAAPRGQGFFCLLCSLLYPQYPEQSLAGSSCSISVWGREGGRKGGREGEREGRRGHFNFCPSAFQALCTCIPCPQTPLNIPSGAESESPTSVDEWALELPLPATHLPSVVGLCHSLILYKASLCQDEWKMETQKGQL